MKLSTHIVVFSLVVIAVVFYSAFAAGPVYQFFVGLSADYAHSQDLTDTFKWYGMRAIAVVLAFGPLVGAVLYGRFLFLRQMRAEGLRRTEL